MSKNLWIGFLLFFLSGLILQPSAAMTAAGDGLILCAVILIPSLFPFFVLSRLLVASGAVSQVSRVLDRVMQPLFRLPGSAAFPLLMGFFSGFPVGARITGDLLEQGELTAEEAKRLVCFCNQPSPLFLIGTIGAGCFGDRRIGYLLFAAQTAAALICGFLLRFFAKGEKKSSTLRKKTQHTPMLQAIPSAIHESVNLMLAVCGYVILFRVLLAILQSFGFLQGAASFFSLFLPETVAEGFVSGLLEVTTGAALVSAAPAALSLRLGVIGFLLGFSGICVYLQISGTASQKGVPTGFLAGAKLLQGMLTAAFALLLSRYVTSLPVAAPTVQYSVSGGLCYALILSFAGVFAFFSIIYIADFLQMRCKRRKESHTNSDWF